MLDQYGEKSRTTSERTSTYTYVPCISLKKAPFRPGPFYTFVLHVSLSTAQLQSCTIQKFESNAVAMPPWRKQRVTKKPRKCRAEAMKKMKSMSEEAAAVRHLVLLSDEDDELNIQQEWDFTFHEMPESDDDDNNDVERLREDFANIDFAEQEGWRSKCGEAARWMVRHCDRWRSHSYSTENAKCKWSAGRIALNSEGTRDALSEESGWTVHYS